MVAILIGAAFAQVAENPIARASQVLLVRVMCGFRVLQSEGMLDIAMMSGSGEAGDGQK
jgi:hypothetical protein